MHLDKLGGLIHLEARRPGFSKVESSALVAVNGYRQQSGGKRPATACLAAQVGLQRKEIGFGKLMVVTSILRRLVSVGIIGGRQKEAGDVQPSLRWLVFERLDQPAETLWVQYRMHAVYLYRVLLVWVGSLEC
jgi:hypothetical protein